MITVIILILATIAIFIQKKRIKTLINQYMETYDLFKQYQKQYRESKKQLIGYYKLFLGRGDTILVEWENGDETYEKVESVNPDVNHIKLDDSVHGSHWCKYEWIKEIITARES